MFLCGAHSSWHRDCLRHGKRWPLRVPSGPSDRGPQGLHVRIVNAQAIELRDQLPQIVPVGAVTANVYALPGASNLGPIAFGDEPIVIFKGERMRFVNADSTEHNVVSDTPAIPEFRTTGPLAPGGQATFSMNTVGETTIHCTIHPSMTGTLIVRAR